MGRNAPSVAVRRRLAEFEGEWRLDRQIVQADGARAGFSGTARFLPVPEGLRYAEEGELILPGQRPVRATRAYLWTEDLSVFFEDGRFFHRVPAAGGLAEHWCAPDHYRVRYDFSRFPDWSATWEVKGPRKDYRMTGRYRRTGGET